MVFEGFLEASTLDEAEKKAERILQWKEDSLPTELRDNLMNQDEEDQDHDLLNYLLTPWDVYMENLKISTQKVVDDMDAEGFEAIEKSPETPDNLDEGENKE